MDPVTFGAKVLDKGAVFAGIPLQLGDPAWGQAFQVIVPPVEPAPKAGREAAFAHKRPNHIETLSGVSGFRQADKEGFGFRLERVGAYFTGDEGAFQTPQLVNHDAARHKNRDLRGAEEESRVSLGSWLD